MDFLKTLKPAQEPRFKSAGPLNGRDKVVKDADAQIALVGRSAKMGGFRWFSVQGDAAKLSFRYGRRVLVHKGVGVYAFTTCPPPSSRRSWRASRPACSRASGTRPSPSRVRG